MSLVLFWALVGCDGGIVQPSKTLIDLTGTIYLDANANGQRDPGEAPAVGFTVFLDADEDNIRDDNERSSTTDGEGRYYFRNLEPNRGYKVIQDLPFGWRNTGGGGLITPFQTAATSITQQEQAVTKTIGTTNINTQTAAVPTLATQIVGGGAALYPNYPFLVALQINGQTACTASLITQGIVLTAAHCLVFYGDTVPTEQVQVLVGTGDLNNTNLVDPSQAWRRISVRRISVHQNYSNILSGHDIAILELSELANQPTVPLVMPGQRQLVAPTASATIIGWGALGDGSYPNLLQEGNITIVDGSYCQQEGEGGGFYRDQELCVYQRGGGVSPCFGDSGGPLLVRDTSTTDALVWRHAGVVSRGPAVCGGRDAADIYTSVPAFTSWIMSEGREISRSYRILPVTTVQPAQQLQQLQATKQGMYQATQVTPDTSNTSDVDGIQTNQADQVSPTDTTIRNLDFGNINTLAPFSLTGALAQATISNLYISSGSSGTARLQQQGTPVTLRWRIGQGHPDLLCELDAEGDGTIDYQTPCPGGEYSYRYAGYPEENLYNPTLYVRLAENVRVRSEPINIVALRPGVLEVPQTLQGDLRLGDTPFNGHTIDFYTLEPTTPFPPNQALTISLSSTDFDAYLRLFDAQTLELLNYNDNIFRSTDARITFMPNPNTRYLIGVSARAAATGTYTISTSYRTP